MSRRYRESIAKGHGNPPLTVIDENPLDHHPGLTPLEHKRIKRIAGKARASKTKVAVKVEVAHGDAE